MVKQMSCSQLIYCHIKINGGKWLLMLMAIAINHQHQWLVVLVLVLPSGQWQRGNPTLVPANKTQNPIRSNYSGPYVTINYKLERCMILMKIAAPATLIVGSVTSLSYFFQLLLLLLLLVLASSQLLCWLHCIQTQHLSFHPKPSPFDVS